MSQDPRGAPTFPAIEGRHSAPERVSYAPAAGSWPILIVPSRAGGTQGALGSRIVTSVDELRRGRESYASRGWLDAFTALSEADRAYFDETIFRGTWGERVRPFLTTAQWQALCHNTDPASSEYCLDRDDFHHIQTLTVCEAYR